MKLPELHDWQHRVLDEAQRFNVLACGRRWGKTTLALDLLTNPALDGLPVAYFAPTYKMLDEFWRLLCGVCADVTETRNASLHRLGLMTGGVIDMWSLTEPNVARGRKYARVVVDEAAQIDGLLSAWGAVMRPTLADYQGDAWFLSTPHGHNDFEALYGRAGGEWAAWQRSTADNPYIAPGEVDAMRRDLGDLYAAQEVDAEFIDAEIAERYLPSVVLWDACQAALPALDAHTPLVLAADAGVSNDCFGLVGVTRHPERHDDIAVRLVRVWEPRGTALDFPAIEDEIRQIHTAFSVVQLCYDPYQLHQMAQQLGGAMWCDAFPQGQARLEADKLLLDLIQARRIAHGGDEQLRQHLDHADRKTDADSRRLRIVKRSPSQKVDLAVALSMATARCLELNV